VAPEEYKEIFDSMGNMPDINKRQVGIRLRLELLKKIENMAKTFSRTVNNQLISILEDGTRDIPLTSQDYYEIAEEVKRNEQKRNNG